MKRVWAIARNTIMQARRMKVVAFVGLFAIAVFPLVLYNLKSSGNPKDELQVLLTYSLEMAAFLLSLLTIFLATWTLCIEVQDKQIFILDSKPVQRHQVLLGKWLGIVIVNAVLLLAMAAPTYGLARWFESRMSPREQEKLASELLIGRRPVPPVYPDLSEEIRREYNKRLQQGTVERGSDLDEVAREIERTVYQRHSTIPHGYSKRWEFRNLPLPEELPEGKDLTIRFTVYSTNPISKVPMEGTWRFADVNGVRVPNYINGRPTTIATRATIGLRYEFSVPPACSAPIVDCWSPTGILTPPGNRPSFRYPAALNSSTPRSLSIRTSSTGA